MGTGTIELTGQADFAACACCGVPTRRVWGNLIDDAGTTAYVVQWAPGARSTHAAVFGLVFGPWGEGSSRDDRYHVAVEQRPIAGKTQFRVIDAGASVIDAAPLAARALSRAEVLSRMILPQVLFYIDQVGVQDARVAELGA